MADLTGKGAREVIEMMQKADPSGRELMGIAYACKQKMEDENEADFTSDMAEMGGFTLLLELVPRAGSAVGYVLDILCQLVLYLNALQQLLDQPETVERLWKLVGHRDPQGEVAIRVARPAVNVLLLIVAKLDVVLKNSGDETWISDTKRKANDVGRAAVHKAAKRLTEKEGFDYYKVLCKLAETSEVDLLANVVCLMRVLLVKTKEESLFKAKKLLFRWQQCGLMDRVLRLSSEYKKLKDMLAALHQTVKQIKVPECWSASITSRTKYENEKGAYDKLGKELFLFQQQQSKIRDVRHSVQKYQETLYAASLQLGVSPLYHPTKRFTEGGGMHVPKTPLPPSARPIQFNPAVGQAELKAVRGQLFDGFKTATDFRSSVEGIVGPVAEPPTQSAPAGNRPGIGALGDGSDDSDDSDGIGPPDDSESDSIDPPTDDSDDDSLPPPSDDDSSSDDMPPPEDGEAPVKSRSGAPGPAGAGPATAAGAATTTDGTPGAGGVAAQGAGTGGADATAAGSAGTAGTAVPPPGAPPPPGAAPVAPPVPGAGAVVPKAPAPPKAPGKGKIPKAPGKKGKGKGKGPSVQWWKGGVSKTKLKVFHWEKVTVGDEKAEGTIWNKVHFGVDCSFDQNDFVEKFQQKAKTGKTEKVVKPQKIDMMDSKKFQNISIMLHKMPEVDQIQKGLELLDTEILNRDCLEAIKAQIPSEEEEEMFVSKIDEKNSRGEEWEKPEQYWRMIIDYNTGVFRKRAESWLFSLDWEEVVVNIVKPLNKLVAAISAVLDSSALPYVMGVLLGFGNLMNAGSQKGNAGGFAPKTLTQLEAARDKSGKINLLQHLVHTVKKERYDALALPDELKETMNNIHSIKYDDLDKAFKDAEDALKRFSLQYKNVVNHVEKAGKKDTDPYVTKMAEFKTGADAELEKLQKEYEGCKEKFMEILDMWSAPRKVKDKPHPEDFFGSLTPFLERFKLECDTIKSEEKSRARHKPSEKLGSKTEDIEAVISDIQQDMVSS